MSRSFPARLPLAALFLSLGGCGLADYEMKLASEQQRLEYFDQENGRLDVPLVMPRIKDQKEGEKLVFGVDLFLRPPLGIRRDPEDQPLGPFYRYLPRNQRCLFRELRLAAAPGEKGDFFNKDILGALPAAGRDTRSAKNAHDRKTLEVRTLEYEEGGTATLFLCLTVVQEQRTNKSKPPVGQVAVGFVIDKTKLGNEARLQMDYCLQSLAVEVDAREFRKAYNARSNYGQVTTPPPPPPRQ